MQDHGVVELLARVAVDEAALLKDEVVAGDGLDAHQVDAHLPVGALVPELVVALALAVHVDVGPARAPLHVERLLVDGVHELALAARLLGRLLGRPVRRLGLGERGGALGGEGRLRARAARIGDRHARALEQDLEARDGPEEPAAAHLVGRRAAQAHEVPAPRARVVRGVELGLRLEVARGVVGEAERERALLKERLTAPLEQVDRVAEPPQKRDDFDQRLVVEVVDVANVIVIGLRQNLRHDHVGAGAPFVQVGGGAVDDRHEPRVGAQRVV